MDDDRSEKTTPQSFLLIIVRSRENHDTLLLCQLVPLYLKQQTRLIRGRSRFRLSGRHHVRKRQDMRKKGSARQDTRARYCSSMRKLQTHAPNQSYVTTPQSLGDAKQPAFLLLKYLRCAAQAIHNRFRGAAITWQLGLLGLLGGESTVAV
jgi:hypothetical protein